MASIWMPMRLTFRSSGMGASSYRAMRRRASPSLYSQEVPIYSPALWRKG